MSTILLGIAIMVFELLFGAISGLDLFFAGAALVGSQIIGNLIPRAPSQTVLGVCLLVLYFTLLRKTIRKPFLFFLQKLGIDVLIGAEAIICGEESVGNKAWVLLHGEIWVARANFSVKPGQKVWVTEVRQQTLILGKGEE